MLNREAIFQPRPRKTIDVPTPEWGDGTIVKIKRLTTGEFLAMSEMEKRHPSKGAALWLINCVVDDDGKAIFTEADVDAFTDQPISVVNRLVAEAQALNFRSSADLLKNSNATQSAA